MFAVTPNLLTVGGFTALSKNRRASEFLALQHDNLLWASRLYFIV